MTKNFWSRWSFEGSDRDLAKKLGINLKTVRRVKADLLLDTGEEEKKDR